MEFSRVLFRSGAETTRIRNSQNDCGICAARTTGALAVCHGRIAPGWANPAELVVVSTGQTLNQTNWRSVRANRTAVRPECPQTPGRPVRSHCAALCTPPEIGRASCRERVCQYV